MNGEASGRATRNTSGRTKGETSSRDSGDSRDSKDKPGTRDQEIRGSAASAWQLLPTQAQSRPTDWYLSRVRGRHKRRAGDHLPSLVPLTAAQLDRAGVTRAARRTAITRVEHGMYVPNELVREEIRDDRASHGYRRGRLIDPVTLVRAHALRRPGHLVTGFGAGAMYGMRYFCEDEPIEFLVPRGSRFSSVEGLRSHLRFRPSRSLEKHREMARHPDHRLPEIAVAAPGTALGHMLRRLREDCPARERWWRVPDLTALREELSPEFIRQVQTSDAFHQAIGATNIGDPARMTGVPVGDAAQVLGVTDVGAESPPETLLRLVLADLAPGLRTQMPVWEDDGRLLTVADMGWEEQRVYVFYDGEHHLQRGQRDHDSRVLSLLQRDGGRVHRVTAGQLSSAESVEELREAVWDGLCVH